MNVAEMYVDGEYLKYNPTWDVEDAPWKADLIIRMLQKHRLEPKTICEVGCGSGEILLQLQKRMSPSCQFMGYDISPKAYEMCHKRFNNQLCFRLKNIVEEHDVFFDVILLIDVIEHLDRKSVV